MRYQIQQARASLPRLCLPKRRCVPIVLILSLPQRFCFLHLGLHRWRGCCFACVPLAFHVLWPSGEATDSSSAMPTAFLLLSLTSASTCLSSPFWPFLSCLGGIPLTFPCALCLDFHLDVSGSPIDPLWLSDLHSILKISRLPSSLAYPLSAGEMDSGGMSSGRHSHRPHLPHTTIPYPTTVSSTWSSYPWLGIASGHLLLLPLTTTRLFIKRISPLKHDFLFTYLPSPPCYAAQRQWVMHLRRSSLVATLLASSQRPHSSVGRTSLQTASSLEPPQQLLALALSISTW